MEEKVREKLFGASKVLESVIQDKDLRKLDYHYQEFITYIYLQICTLAELLDDRDDEVLRVWSFACEVYKEMRWGCKDDE